MIYLLDIPVGAPPEPSIKSFVYRQAKSFIDRQKDNRTVHFEVNYQINPVWRFKIGIVSGYLNPQACLKKGDLYYHLDFSKENFLTIKEKPHFFSFKSVKTLQKMDFQRMSIKFLDGSEFSSHFWRYLG